MPNLGIWIQEMPDTRAIAFHAVGPNAQDDGFCMMVEWILQQQLPDGYIPKVYGYTKPLNSAPGHEILLGLPPSGSFTPAASLRQLPACAYACVTSRQPEWDFVRQHIATGPYHVREGNQWARTDAYGPILQQQWMMEYHADREEMENCIRTGLSAPQFHHFTLMIPIARKES